MHAVRGIDLQALAALAVVDHLVDAHRAITRAGIVVLDTAARCAEVEIRNLQVHRLRFVVRGGREEHGCEPVARRQAAIDPAAIR